MSFATVHAELRAALRDLEKGRRAGTMTTHHAALHAHIQDIHDHPDTHPEAKAALAKVLDHSHGLVKPKAPKIPKARKPYAPGPHVQQHIDAYLNGFDDPTKLEQVHGTMRADSRLTARDWMHVAHHTAGRGRIRYRRKADAQDAVLKDVGLQRQLHGIVHKVDVADTSGN